MSRTEQTYKWHRIVVCLAAAVIGISVLGVLAKYARQDYQLDADVKVVVKQSPVPCVPLPQNTTHNGVATTESSTSAGVDSTTLETMRGAGAESTTASDVATASVTVKVGGRHDDDAQELQGSENLLDAKPLVWFHAPKCGTSFINTLLHQPQLCPYWPPSSVVGENSVLIQTINVDVASRGVQETCPGAFTRFAGSHASLGEYLMNSEGRNVLGFFRQPEQRLLSHYYFYMRPDVLEQRKKAGWNLAKFARGARGCMTRILATRAICELWRSRVQPKLNPEIVNRAVQIVENRFIFVGLTEKWRQSICLFHLRFGGRCCPFEMQNQRPGYNHQLAANTTAADVQELAAKTYNISVLEGVVDRADGQVYDAAKRVWEEDIRKAGATEAVCRELCSKDCS